MLKKSLLSLAVAASLGVSGCNISSTSGNADADSVQPDVTPEELAAQRGVFPIFDPANGAMPLGIDLILASASATDGTANTGKAGTPEANPITNAIDRLDGGIGLSTPIDIPMSGSVIDGSTVAGQQVLGGGVFLIELESEYLVDADGDTTAETNIIDSLDVSEIALLGTSAVANVLSVAGGQIAVSTISVDGGTDNVIRISPLSPLKPKTKYIVAILKDNITNAAGTTIGTAVLDASGNEINQDINYEAISGTEPLAIVSTTFDAVRAALGGWGQLAAGGVGAALSAAASETITVAPSNFALVNAFTTVRSDEPLLGMAIPEVVAASWIKGALVSNVKAGVKETVTDSTALLAGMEAAVVANNATYTSAQASLPTALAAVESYSSHAVAPRTSKFLPSQYWVDESGDTGFGGAAGAKVIQGQLELPYFLGIPTRYDSDTSTATTTAAAALAVQGTLMSADAAIGEAFKNVLAPISVAAAGGDATDATLVAAAKASLTIPPQDADGNSYVNGRYPFATKTGDVSVPVLVHAPDLDNNDALDCGSDIGALCDVTIFVHGITGNRTHSIPLANGGLAATGMATVAIDLPLHGIAPVVSGASDPSLAFSVDSEAAVNGAQLSAVFDALSFNENFGERHFGYGTSATGTLTPFVYDDITTTETNEAVVAENSPTLMGNGSGAAFINFSNFAVTRDLMRQSVSDLMNVSASLATMDIDGDGVVPDFDMSDVHVVGHSLGGILATTFVHTLNSTKVALALAGQDSSHIPTIQSLSLVASGGQVSRILENSPSFAGEIDATPINSDLTPNENFGLLAQLNALGIAQGTTNYESFLKVFQATVDGVDPINYAGGTALSAQPILALEIVGDSGAQIIDGETVNKSDQTVPNEANDAPLGNANPAPLAGTDPLIAEFGLTKNVGTNPTVASRQYIQLIYGEHGTLVKTSGDSSAAEGTLDKETYDNTFLSQIVHMSALAGFISSDGANVGFADTTLPGPVTITAAEKTAIIQSTPAP